MKVSLLQTDIKWNAPEDNRAHLLYFIYAASHADLFVLPETFTTGFDTGKDSRPEPEGIQTLEWMTALAKEKGAAIAGSIGVEDSGMKFNRMYFVRPDGSFSQYDKKHLFTYGGEDKHYTPGKERVIVEYNCWRILL